MFKNVIIGVGIVAAVLTIIIFSGNTSFGNKSTTTSGEVMIWGTAPESKMSTFLQVYNPAVKTYRVNYKEIKEEEFVTTLIDALASGGGPDLILAPYQIIISQVSKVQPFPVTAVPEKSYRDTFVNGASIFWTPFGAMSLPVSIEPLMLFYNRTMLSKNGVVQPPTYWGDIGELIPKLTTFDKKGNLDEIAIPLGTFDNIPYAKDILMNMVYQLTQTPVVVSWSDKGPSYSVSVDDPVYSGSTEIRPLSTAVRFWTEFANKDKTVYTWNNFMQNPHQLFLGEKLAMYIGFSSEYDQIKQENQKIDFGMKEIPQAKDYKIFSTGMRLYGIATLKTSKNINTAMETQSSFAGTYSNDVASIIGGVSPIKANLVNKNLDEGLVKSTLNARGFYDLYENKTTILFSKMIDDIITGRTLVIDSVANFVNKFDRLYDSSK